MKIKANGKPIIPDGYDWTIEYNNPIKEVDFSKLVLHQEPEQKGGSLKGEIIAERVKDKSMNSEVLEYLLKHQKLIPNKWKGKYIYFCGTIYRDSDDDLCVRCLYCGVNGVWNWCSYYLDVVFGSPSFGLLLASTPSSEPVSSLESLSFDRQSIENLSIDFCEKWCDGKARAVIELRDEIIKIMK